MTSRARARLMRAVFAACRKRGLDDEARRDVIEQVTGRRSLTALTVNDIGAVLDVLNSGAGRGGDGGDPPWRRKITALWISAHQLGLTDSPDPRALDRFVERQTGVAALRFVPASKAASVIEALKDWLARPVTDSGGGVNWSWPPDADDREKVAHALWRRLAECGAVTGDSPDLLESYCRRILAIPQQRPLTPSEWGRVLPVLAEKLKPRKDGT